MSLSQSVDPIDLKKTNDDSLDAFFKDDRVLRDIRNISGSKYATFRDPKSKYQMIINILNVSKSKRMSDKQFGAEFCEITTGA